MACCGKRIPCLVYGTLFTEDTENKVGEERYEKFIEDALDAGLNHIFAEIEGQDYFVGVGQWLGSPTSLPDEGPVAMNDHLNKLDKAEVEKKVTELFTKYGIVPEKFDLYLFDQYW